MRLMSKIEYVIVPKGRKFMGSGELELNSYRLKAKVTYHGPGGGCYICTALLTPLMQGFPTCSPRRNLQNRSKPKRCRPVCFFGDFGLKLYGPRPLIIWKNFLSQYALGPYLICTLFQEHVCYVLLEECAFQIWSWLLFDLECSSRSLMVQD